MDGVTILNTSIEYVSGPGLTIGVMILTIFAVLLVISSFVLFTISEDEIAAPAFVAALMVSAFAFLIYLDGNKQYESYEVYQVTIDESVSYKEFTERYEVLKQEGLIYTIRERNN